MTKQIPLTGGKSALVSDMDFDWLSSMSWTFSVYGYAVCSTERKTYYMHRLISGVDGDVVIDHKNGNRLDNRRENLRVCTRAENMFNRKKQVNNKSGYKGVDWRKSKNKYRASIQVGKKRYHIGYYDDPKEAASAYDQAAIKYFGEFARTNF